MKTTLFLMSLLTSTLIGAQQFMEVVKWEVPTAQEGKIFGISITDTEALMIIDNYRERNADLEFPISGAPKIMNAMIKVTSTENPYKTFRKLAEHHYKFLSRSDLETLQIIKKEGFNKGIEHYRKAKGYSMSFSISRFTNLIENYARFMINGESDIKVVNVTTKS